MESNGNEKYMGGLKYGVVGAAVLIAGQLALKGAVSASLPTIMSYTGTVVSGVGTYHSAITATAASFAAAPISVPLVVGGAVVSGGFFLYKYSYSST